MVPRAAPEPLCSPGSSLPAESVETCLQQGQGLEGAPDEPGCPLISQGAEMEARESPGCDHTSTQCDRTQSALSGRPRCPRPGLLMTPSVQHLFVETTLRGNREATGSHAQAP